MISHFDISPNPIITIWKNSQEVSLEKCRMIFWNIFPEIHPKVNLLSNQILFQLSFLISLYLLECEVLKKCFQSLLEEQFEILY